MDALWGELTKCYFLLLGFVPQGYMGVRGSLVVLVTGLWSPDPFQLEYRNQLLVHSFFVLVKHVFFSFISLLPTLFHVDSIIVDTV